MAHKKAQRLSLPLKVVLIAIAVLLSIATSIAMESFWPLALMVGVFVGIAINEIAQII